MVSVSLLKHMETSPLKKCFIYETRRFPHKERMFQI